MHPDMTHITAPNQPEHTVSLYRAVWRAELALLREWGMTAIRQVSAWHSPWNHWEGRN